MQERPVTFEALSSRCFAGDLRAYRTDSLDVFGAEVSGQETGTNMPAVVSKCRAKPARLPSKSCLSRHGGNELELEVHCSKGTYIRTYY